jgi:hypothetical protein
MFNYYRFIGCEYSTVENKITTQALTDNCSIRIMHNYAIEDSIPNQITIIIVGNHIKDIFRN